MRGVVLSCFSVFCVGLFCLCLFVSNNLLVFWLFLELGALSLIPAFFLKGESGVFISLFNYIIVSGVSSSLIIGGIIFNSLFFLTVLGLMIKFGLFPFMGWVYAVLLSSNWLVVWVFSTLLKTGFLFFPFFISCGWNSWLLLSGCVFTFVLASGLIWFYTYSWVYFWCHLMICSSASLILMSVELSVDSLVMLFLVYVVWSSLVIFFLSGLDEMRLSGSSFYFWFVFLLVSFPGSMAIFYKLIVGSCMFSCGLWAFFFWVVYNVSEQFYLVKYLIGCGVPRLEWWGGLEV